MPNWRTHGFSLKLRISSIRAWRRPVLNGTSLFRNDGMVFSTFETILTSTLGVNFMSKCPNTSFLPNIWKLFQQFSKKKKTCYPTNFSPPAFTRNCFQTLLICLHGFHGIAFLQLLLHLFLPRHGGRLKLQEIWIQLGWEVVKLCVFWVDVVFLQVLFFWQLLSWLMLCDFVFGIYFLTMDIRVLCFFDSFMAIDTWKAWRWY